jgi:hypothetical protein
VFSHSLNASAICQESRRLLSVKVRYDVMRIVVPRQYYYSTQFEIINTFCSLYTFNRVSNKVELSIFQSNKDR